MEWQLQQAKQKFSEVVKRAQKEGPQVVMRDGEPVVVIVAAQEFDQLIGKRPVAGDPLVDPPYSDEFAQILEDIWYERRHGHPRPLVE